MNLSNEIDQFDGNEIINDNNSSLSLWTEKYKPRRIKDIIGHTENIGIITSWLKNFNSEKKKAVSDKTKKKRKYTRSKVEVVIDDDTVENYDYDIENATLASSKVNKGSKSCLLISGDHGVGKTCSVNVILSELKYDIEMINFNNVKSNMNIKEKIEKIINNNNILTSMNNLRRSDIAIVIDEIESITSTTDKSYIMTLLKTNEEFWYCPIILISNNQHNKFLTEIKKSSIEVKFRYPYYDEIHILLTYIAKKENIIIKEEPVISKIIDHSQKDIRRLINTMQDIKYTYNDKILTEEKLNLYCELSKKKDIDFNLFAATDELLFKYKTIDDCLKYYETEKVLLPLMIHHNYILNLKSSNSTAHNTINRIAESLSKGDVIENYIYGDQNWDINEIHGVYTCVIPSYCMSIYKNKRPYKNVSFTTDLNKTSIKKINKKNVLNANRCFTHSNINDYIYMNKILKKIISTKHISKCDKILGGYDIKLEHVESLLKIDKINKTSEKKLLLLTSKQKKEIQNVLKK